MSRADTFLVLKQKKENFVRNKRRWFLRCIHLLTLVVFLARPSPDSILFIFKQTLQILQQINVKNVYPLSTVGIQTHALLNMSLLP